MSPFTQLQQPHRHLRPGRLPRPQQPDPEPRPHLGVHVAAGREGRPPVNIDLTHGAAPAGRAERQQPRALRRLLRRLRAARGLRLDATSRLGRPRRVRDRAVHGGHGQEPEAPANPPFYFEGRRVFDATTGRRHAPRSASRTSSRSQRAARAPSIRIFAPDLRPQLTKQWNVFVERKLTNSLSAQVGYVGSRSSHMVVPFDFNQPDPGTGPVEHVGAPRPAAAALPAEPEHRHHQRHELDRCRRLRRAAGEPASAPDGRPGVPRVLHLQQGAERQRRLLRRRLGADRGPGLLLPGQHATRCATTDRRPTTCGTSSASPPTTSCRSARDARTEPTGAGCKNADPRRMARSTPSSRSHTGFPDHRLRRRRPIAAGHAVARAAEPSATAIRTPAARTTPGSTSTASSTRPVGQFGDSGVGILRGRATGTVDLGLSKNFYARRQALPHASRLEAFNVLNHPNFAIRQGPRTSRTRRASERSRTRSRRRGSWSWC